AAELTSLRPTGTSSRWTAAFAWASAAGLLITGFGWYKSQATNTEQSARLAAMADNQQVERAAAANGPGLETATATLRATPGPDLEAQVPRARNAFPGVDVAPDVHLEQLSTETTSDHPETDPTGAAAEPLAEEGSRAVAVRANRGVGARS